MGFSPVLSWVVPGALRLCRRRRREGFGLENHWQAVKHLADKENMEKMSAGGKGYRDTAVPTFTHLLNQLNLEYSK